MKYKDEEIVSILNQHKKGITGDIESGLWIREELFHFRRTILCKNSFSMMLPLRFLVPSQIVMKRKSGTNAPAEVFCNQTGSIEINFNYYNNENTQETPLDIVNTFEAIMKRLNAGITTYEKKEKEIDGGVSIGWVDYKQESFGSSIYNIFFAMSIADKKYIGQFMCGLQDAVLWKQVFLKMIETLQIERS